MKIRHILVLFGILLISLILVSCGDETVINNYYENEPGIPSATPSADDTDGDGLTDEEELQQYGTSPILWDTDGDGLSDYIECVEYAFDPSNNPYKYNPLVADVPKLGIIITSPPSVSLHLTDTTGVSRTFETSRSDESAKTVSTSTTDTNTHAIEMTHTTSVHSGLFTCGEWSFLGLGNYNKSYHLISATSGLFAT